MPRPTTKLEDHPLLAVRDCLFNLFTATLHIGGHSSIRNLRTRHAMVTGTHKHGSSYQLYKKMRHLFEVNNEAYKKVTKVPSELNMF